VDGPDQLDPSEIAQWPKCRHHDRDWITSTGDPAYEERDVGGLTVAHGLGDCFDLARGDESGDVELQAMSGQRTQQLSGLLALVFLTGS
jgi:hypothetical protein